MSEPERAWPKGSKIGGGQKDVAKDKGRVNRIPFPAASGHPKKLMPVRCPLAEHDKISGMPLKFGLGPSQDHELEKKLLSNMRLSDIDKLVNEAGPSEKSARGGGGERELQPRPPDKPRRAPSGSGGSAASGQDDMSLMTAMAGRLRNAEESAAALREELRKRDATIAELRSSLVRSEGMEFVRRSSNNSPSDAAVAQSSEADLSMVKEHNAKLREMLRRADAENKRLVKENSDIKAFLKDYGMQWVGDGKGAPRSSSRASPNAQSPESAASRSPDSSASDGADLDLKEGLWQPGVALGHGPLDSKPADLNDTSGTEALGCPFDPARIASNVKQLNFIAGEGEKEIAVGKDGMRRFKEKCLVSYIFYKNGIFGRGGPLRPYKLPESKVLVNDLMDGYFPWELKDEYPEGVPLRVEFRLAECWGKNSIGDDNVPRFTPFAGAGQALGAAPGEGHVDGVSGGKREVWQPAAGRGAGETLFRRLPANVVGANGEVIPVKDDIMKLVKGDASKDRANTKVEIEQVQSVSEPEAAGCAASQGGGGGGGEISTLRIKTPDGGTVLELRLPCDSTVGDLRAAVREHLMSKGNAHVAAFTIRTSFPAREYDKDAETLRDAGLFPNALLLMTPKS